MKWNIFQNISLDFINVVRNYSYSNACHKLKNCESYLASTLECPCVVGSAWHAFECTLEIEDDFALYITRTSFDLLIPVWVVEGAKATQLLCWALSQSNTTAERWELAQAQKTQLGPYLSLSASLVLSLNFFCL